MDFLRTRRTFCLLGMAASLLFNGCGSGTYETRLQETVKYYEFQQEYDRALEPASPLDGFSMRLPKGFTLLPATTPDEEGGDGESTPEAEATEPGGGTSQSHLTLPLTSLLFAQTEVAQPGSAVPSTGETEPTGATDAFSDPNAVDVGVLLELPGDDEFDPRQPDYFDVRLPGLVGAWRKPFNVRGTEVNGYAYLLSNHPILEAQKAERRKKEDQDGELLALKIDEFYPFVAQRLSRAVFSIREELKAPLEQSWRKYPIPQPEPEDRHLYSQQREFWLNGSSDLKNLVLEETAYDLFVYRFESPNHRPVQAVMIFVLPAGEANEGGTFSKAIQYSLQSLTLNVRGTAGVPGGGSPAATGPTGF